MRRSASCPCRQERMSRKRGKDNNLLELIAADPEFNLTLEQLAGNHGAVQVCRTRTGTGGCIPCKCCKSGIGEESRRTRRKGGDQRITEKWLKTGKAPWCFGLFLWNCPNKHIMFALISNIIRRPHRGISDGNADGNSVQKYGISNQPNVCIFDDPCLSSLEHSAGHVRIPEDNL